jgi:hypothetical protein
MVFGKPMKMVEIEVENICHCKRSLKLGGGKCCCEAGIAGRRLKRSLSELNRNGDYGYGV